MKTERWQKIEELYHQALELDVTRRDEFLRQRCGEDQSLREELKSLLACAKPSEKFIESPAIMELGKLLASEMPTAEPKDELVGRIVSHYRVIESVATGGMGRIYKAEDIRLHRFVALKFLPKGFAQDPLWLARFEREAQAASALNHPNICTVYDVGGHEGNAFIAMEFLEGQTLEQLIGGRALPIAEILDLGVQVAEALEVAHRNGIIHRDLKPANIFVCRGHVKLLDFGLAKLTGRIAVDGNGVSAPVEEHLTEAGMAMGTVAYMSPEQVLGGDLDARTDLFSLGVVLYEMATGHRPFEGKTPGAIFAAVIHETPRSPLLLIPNLSPKLASIVTKALQKNLEQRYQSATELASDLKQLKREIESGESNPVSDRLQAIQGKILWKVGIPILSIALMVGIFYGSRLRKASLTENDTVVLADFVNQTGDPVFGDSLKQALSTELGQSPFLNVLPERKVDETLRLMGRPANTPISVAIGREICQRTGSTALISGTISGSGKLYLLNLSAIACQAGNTLAQEQQTTSKENILNALGQTSSALRRHLGESLPSVQKFETPVEETTTSLEALRSYHMALSARYEKGNDATIPLLCRAIELDPNFPMAYAELAMTYSNLFETSQALENASKAYELRNRVSEREKLRITTTYFRMTGQIDKAIEAYREWIVDYPRDLDPYMRLSVTYADIGQYENAVAEHEQALTVAPNDGRIYADLGFEDINLNQFEEAKARFDEAARRKLDDNNLPLFSYYLAFLEQNEPEMQRQLALSKPGTKDEMLSMESDTEAYFGRVRKARELSLRAADSALQSNAKEAAAYWKINSALRDAELGNFFEARRALAAALALSKGKDVKIVAALTLARIGDPRSEAIVKKLKQDYPRNVLLRSYWLPTIRAAMAIRRGNSEEALAELKGTETYELGIAGMFVNYVYPAYVRGQAHLMAHNGKAAAAEFQKLIDHSGIVTNFVTGSLAHLEIARAYAASGDTVAAKAAYENFLTLWKGADPDLQLLKQAREEYSRLQSFQE